MANRASVRRALKRMLIAVFAVVLIAGVAGYFVFRIQTPVSLESAVDRFREGNDGVTSGRHQVNPSRARHGSKLDRGGRKMSTRGAGGSAPGAGESARTVSATTSGISIAIRGDARSPLFDVMPAEGVYSYVGSGREGIFPYYRDFPTKVTHRIITHADRNTWVEHHIFSEERASWTRISTSETGRLVPYQRNFIKVGTYEEDKTFPFRPPIQAVLFPPRVGQVWEGEFTGRTINRGTSASSGGNGEDYTGNYTVRMVGEEHWNIGGTRVRVLGYDFDVVLEGEFNGTVSVDYWFAPRYGLTVREEYWADAKVGVLDYEGRWFVKLRSLTPRT